MFTIENSVGRLVELRMASPITLEELGGFHGAVSKIVARHPGQVVVCTDLLSARVFDQHVTERLTTIIRQESPRVERNAFMVGDGAVFSMQIERIIRDAGFANRRAFRVPTDLITWLGEVLTSAERERLAKFLREGSNLRKDQK